MVCEISLFALENMSIKRFDFSNIFHIMMTLYKFQPHSGKGSRCQQSRNQQMKRMSFYPEIPSKHIKNLLHLMVLRKMHHRICQETGLMGIRIIPEIVLGHKCQILPVPMGPGLLVLAQFLENSIGFQMQTLAN